MSQPATASVHWGVKSERMLRYIGKRKTTGVSNGTREGFLNAEETTSKGSQTSWIAWLHMKRCEKMNLPQGTYYLARQLRICIRTNGNLGSITWLIVISKGGLQKLREVTSEPERIVQQGSLHFSHLAVVNQESERMKEERLLPILSFLKEHCNTPAEKGVVPPNSN